MTSSKDHSVTIVTIVSLCNASLHTWLVFNTGETFSLIPPNNKCAITSDCEAKLEITSNVNGRRYNLEKSFDITEAEYKRMIQKKSDLESDKTYALMPLRENEYNCVTACREVLEAGNIKFLNDVSTPIGVGPKITGHSSYAEIDIDLCIFAVLPRASVAITEAVGFDLGNGLTGWIFASVVFTFFATVQAQSFLSKHRIHRN